MSVINFNSKINQARNLRQRMTSAEKLLWRFLRNKKLGYKFRRQALFGPYILDYYCPKLRLVIEVDGDVHALKNVYLKDKIRQKYLENSGLIVKRFWNHQVLEDIDSVIETIIIIAKQIQDIQEKTKEELRQAAININRRRN